jgi:hypothetical protein
MALYRFLFAPALLIVALVAGSGERARPSAAPVPGAQAVRASLADGAAAPTAASAAKPAARPLPRAELARAHPEP